jgi:hypothetical protein
MESVQPLAVGARVIVARGAMQGLLACVVAIGSDAHVEIDVFPDTRQALQGILSTRERPLLKSLKVPPSKPCLD